MKETTFYEYVHKALDAKIGSVALIISLQQKKIDAPIGSHDDEIIKLRNEAMVHLERYKKAKKQFDLLVDLVAGIDKDFRDVEEGSDAEVLDDAINDCLFSINEFQLILKGKKEMK